MDACFEVKVINDPCMDFCISLELIKDTDLKVNWYIIMNLVCGAVSAY